MRSDVEFRHNKPPTIHPEYEIIKWNDGDHCYTVAIFEYGRKEFIYCPNCGAKNGE